MDKILGSPETIPKTISLVQPMFDDSMTNFASQRGEWMKRSLGSMVNRVDEIDEGGIWEGGRAREKVRGLISLWEVMVVMLEVCENAWLCIALNRADARRRHS